MARWAVLVALATGCRPDCTPARPDAPPNVILVTVDTLRADHLGCYGNPAVRTPELDRLAAEGARFERCYAQSHLTVPSHASLLTSLPLGEHGIWNNATRAPRRLDTLADVFARAGYRTAAFVSAKHVGPDGPLAPLFSTPLGTYRVIVRPGRQTTAADTNRKVFPWLRASCRDPFFLWVHYWDPHMPYTPPAPWDGAYYAGDARDPRHTSLADVTLGWGLYDLRRLRHDLVFAAPAVRSLKDDFGLRSEQVRSLMISPVDLGARAPGREEELRRRLHALGITMRRRLRFLPALAGWLTGVRDLRFALAQYAGEVSYLDHEIGRLRDTIERLGIAERTVLVVTADHGELLGEHGVHFEHLGLYEPVLRVPLIVWAPGRVTPSRRAEPVRGLDVAPTVLRLAGLDVPAGMRGSDLLAAEGVDPPIVVEAQNRSQLAVIDGNWKLIRTFEEFDYLEGFAHGAGELELYDLATDPAERTNRIATDPEAGRRLAATIDAWTAVVGGPPAGGGERGPPALTEHLRALGYIE